MSAWLTLMMLGQRVVPGGAATHFPGLLEPMLAAVATAAVIGAASCVTRAMQGSFTCQ